MIRIRPYRPEDETALLKLASVPMPGWIRLRYDYTKGYAAGEELKGDRMEILVAEDPEGIGLLGCGTRSSRSLWLDGNPQRVGYLSGLRSFPAARNGFGLFRGLQTLRQRMASDPVACAYTTILTGNPKARALLTSGRAGLPRYIPHGKVITWTIAPRRPETGTDPIPTDALHSFYEREAPRRSLFPVFGTGFHRSLTERDFFAIRREGRIVAAAAVWDHGSYRRLVVDGYGNPLAALLRLPVNLWARCAGYPALPSGGKALGCVYLAYALAENDDPILFAELVARAASRTGGRNLVVALHDSDPLCAVMLRCAAWRYESEFMTVSYDESERPFSGVPHIEVGAL